MPAFRSLSRLLLLLGLSLPGWGQAQPAKPFPTRQRWRVNDTLVLECSRPLAQFSFGDVDQPTPTLLWGRAVLRGRRGSAQVLYRNTLYCTLYGAAVSAKGDVLRVAIWSARAEWMVAARAHPQQVIEGQEDYEFDYWTWDVRHHTRSELLDADLRPLHTEQEGESGFRGQVLGFTGGTYRGKPYHLLPYWIARERTRLARTHRLPAASLLENYINLGIHCVLLRESMMPPPYRPALARLLRAYRVYPLPPATARSLHQALNALAAAKH